VSWRLALASLWLPPWTIRCELSRVGAATTSVLDRLLAARSPEALEGIGGDAFPLRGSLEERREALAAGHTTRITHLTEVLGWEAGIGEARRVLFKAGVELGEEARRRLGVDRTRRDLLRAARILYRVLGIHFQAEWVADGAARVRITRCALARGYTPDACLALSATDAGVVAGLWPGTKLEFDERITEGKAACLAHLVLPEVVVEGSR
jgi:hypothetical protein